MDFTLDDDETAVIEAGAQVAGGADPWAALVEGGWLDLLLEDPADGFRYLGLVAEQIGAAASSVPLIGAAAVWPSLFAASAGGRRVGVVTLDAGASPAGSTRQGSPSTASTADGAALAGGPNGAAGGGASANRATPGQLAEGVVAGGDLAEDGVGAEVLVVFRRGGPAEAFESFTAEPAGGLPGDTLARLTVTGPTVASCDRPAAIADAHYRAGALAASEVAGLIGRVAAMTAEYVKERKQFGRSISAFQVVGHGAAQLAILAEGALWAARTACAAPEPANVHAAKGWSSRAAQEASAIAHQLHGAIGFTEEYGLQVVTKRLRTMRFAWGDDSAHFRALGRLVTSGI